MGGFSRDIRSRIRGMQSHITVSAQLEYQLYISDYEDLISEIKKIPHVISCSPRIQYNVWLGKRAVIIPRNIVLVGIDPDKELENLRMSFENPLVKYFSRGNKRVLNFNYDDSSIPVEPGVVCGSEMLNRGSSCSPSIITLVTTRPMSGGFAYLEKKFEVVGNFKTGMAEYDSSFIFANLKDVQKFLRLDSCQNNGKGVITDIAITLDDYNKANKAKPLIEEIIKKRYKNPALRPIVETWEETKAILLRAVSIEKNIQIVILFFIIIVAGFNVIAIFTLMVKTKVKDIGILRALGATRNGISTIFLLAGSLCGTIGSCVGVILGVGISYNLNSVVEFARQKFGFELFPKDVYYLDAVPVEIDPQTIIIIVLLTMVVSLVASIYPAVKAANLDPIEAIRYE